MLDAISGPMSKRNERTGQVQE